jgi:hypothetical protein
MPNDHKRVGGQKVILVMEYDHDIFEQSLFFGNMHVQNISIKWLHQMKVNNLDKVSVLHSHPKILCIM